ncbi:MAG: hypothetical protein M0R05_07565 [Bacilli bacterium]|nr:hypothetical protein [Bacilli bacterium]MDD4077850.1 hypothetical protein [Bacilli bacterium]MDD4388088.1 hypothetical protein [Bacilli bacterium]
MKRTTQNTLGLLSFVALILFTASAFLSQIGAKMSFFIWVGNGMLLFVVLCLAYYYVKKLAMTWKVIYYVIAILAIISFIWGIGVF